VVNKKKKKKKSADKEAKLKLRLMELRCTSGTPSFVASFPLCIAM
jgi:hypothetical protein